MTDCVRLKNIIELVGSKPKYFKGEKTYISTGDANANMLFADNVITYESKPSRADLEVKETDIIVAKMKNTNKTTHILGDLKEYIYSTGFFAFNSTQIYNRYLYYLLSCQEFTEWKDVWSLGTTQMSLNEDHLKFIYVHYVKDKDKQQSIASYLDKKVSIIDGQIEKNKKSIDLLIEYKSSIVDKILDPKEHWKILKLRFLGQLQNGISAGAERFNVGYPFINYTDVYNNMILPNEFQGTFDSTDSERENYSVKRGDVFFTRTSETIEEVGFSSVCVKDAENATFSGFLIRFRPIIDVLNPQYSKYYFRSNQHRAYFAREMNIISRASLGQNLLKNMKVLIPTKEEQQQIASYLDDKYSLIDKVIDYRKQIIEKLEEYRKSLIYEAVTGKIEV